MDSSTLQHTEPLSPVNANDEHLSESRVRENCMHGLMRGTGETASGRRNLSLLYCSIEVFGRVSSEASPQIAKGEKRNYGTRRNHSKTKLA